MKKAIILTALGLTFVSAASQAQTLTRAQKHTFNVEALRMLDSYEDYGGMHTEAESADFRALFPPEGINVYNDLLGLSVADSLSVDDYVSLLEQKSRNALVRLKNIRKKKFWEDSRSWFLGLTFDKGIMYTTLCGAIIDASNYYGGDYTYEAVVAMDKETNDIYIVSLKGAPASQRRRLPSDFTFVEFNSPLDSAVTVDGERLRFSHGQALVPRDAEFVYFDDDANLKVRKEGDDACAHYAFSFKPMRWRVKAHADISLGSPYSISDGDGINTSVSATDFGVDVGYIFPSKSKFKIGVFAGLGYSTGKLDLSLDKLDYNYDAPASADMDGDTYRRYYELSDMKQDVSLNFLSLPVYAHFEYRFSRRISAFVDLGVKAYFNAGSKANPFTGKSYSYGIYPQYDDLRIDDSWLNGFGESAFASDSSDDIDIKGFSADVLAGAGVEIKVFGPLSVDLGVSYQLGVTDVLGSASQSGALAGGAITEGMAPVTYQVAGGTQVKNLATYLGSVKRQSLKLNVGLVFKF